MQKPNDLRSRWVQKEAAKHTAPNSIRQRIAHETEQVRILSSAGLTSGPMGDALEAHHELIQVLMERLSDFDKRTYGTANKLR
jgi:hypothetical protein